MKLSDFYDLCEPNREVISALIKVRDEAKGRNLNKLTRATKEDLKRTTQNLKIETRCCKDKWLSKKGKEIQLSADSNNIKSFHELVNEIYETRKKGFASLKSSEDHN